MAKSTRPSGISWEYETAIVLVTILGMQLLRALLPYFLFVLRDRLGWSTTNAGLLALAIFLCAFLAGPLNRLLGSRLLILGTGSIIGLSRLSMQLWTKDPLWDMVFAIAGVIAFAIFLPTAVGVASAEGRVTAAGMALALLAGIALDLALNGAWLSYDLVWQTSTMPLLITVILVIGLVAILFVRLGTLDLSSSADMPFLRALPWAATGPFLFLQLLVFANIAWAATTSGLTFYPALFWLLLAHGLAIALWIFLPEIVRIAVPAAWVLAIALQAAIMAGQTASWISVAFLLCGQIALAGSLVAILSYLGGIASRTGLRGLTLAGGIGMILMVILLFAYYAAYDLQLPFSNRIIPLVSLLTIALLAFPALRNLWDTSLPGATNHQRILTSAVFTTLFIPVVLYFIHRDPDYTQPASGPLRVMTYNLHNGFNPLGQLDLETLAQVIEAEDPHVVGLQEVSRGWVLNGSGDMVTWLANRLEMEPLFGPTADPQWGNAVLTRLPLVESAAYPLPTEELLLRRGFIYARLLGPNGKEFDFIDTHYHNPADGGDIRVAQSTTIIDFLAGRSRAIMVGDLNSEHGDPEIDMLVESGLDDVLYLTGLKPGHTNPVPGPTRRIDYIFVTADWEASRPTVPPVEASDHLPIAITLAGIE